MPSDQSAREGIHPVIGVGWTTMIDGRIRMTARKLFVKRFGFRGHSLVETHQALIATRIVQIKEMEATLAKVTTTTVKTPLPSLGSLTKAAG